MKLFISVCGVVALAMLCLAAEPDKDRSTKGMPRLDRDTKGADKPAKPSRPTVERIQLVRQLYEKLPCEILGIVEPVTLAGVGYSSGVDFRAVSVTLKDAKGRKLEIYLDRWPGTESVSLSLDGEGTGRLPHRGPEESAVYGLLLRLPKATREEAAAVVPDILEVLDKRIAGAMPGGASK